MSPRAAHPEPGADHTPEAHSGPTGGSRRLQYAVAAGLAVLAVILAVVGALGPQGPTARVTRTVARHDVPEVTLVNQDGAAVRLSDLLAADRPVFLHFIYVTCTTTSPVLCAAFSGLQRELGSDSRAARLVSVTIDPENDSPPALKEHLRRYRALPGWDFLTGTRGDVDAVMKAFEAFMPDKEHHYPVTFARGRGDGPWVRLEGLVNRADLVREWRQLAGPPPG